jgi:dihydrofolate synthase / folylpolyglutamate synthase
VPEQAVDIIHRRSALDRGLVADRSPDQAVAERGLRRMGVLLEKLGNPQQSYRAIHVAGSKGKGTTTYIAAAVLTALGYRTGRYVSPHLLTWNERIAIDNQSISDAEFTTVLAVVDRAMSELERQVPDLGTFNAFELLTAAAFIHFRDRQCDVAVIEVGLGGRFDSTNHVHPEVSVITRIEAEHLDILGPTLEQVAWNKAGIIKPGIPVVIAVQQPVVEAVLESEADRIGAPLLREGIEWTMTPTADSLCYRTRKEAPPELTAALPGVHNRSNIGAALTAVATLIGEEQLPVDLVSAVLESIGIPGRFDRRVDPLTGRTIVLDGAHTLESIHALIESMHAEYGSELFPVIMGLLVDKPAAEILSVLEPAASRIIFPNNRGPRIVPAQSLLETALQLGMQATVLPTIRAALDEIGPGPEPVLITGSFGIVAAAIADLSMAA